MKQIILLISFLIPTIHTSGQSFTKITSGDYVNTKSGSRSANFIDINGDGWDDIFISNGPSTGENNMLYLNNQDGTFTTVQDDPIVNDGAKSDGASFGDADNDGDLDAYVVTWYGQKNNYYLGQDDNFVSINNSNLTEASTYSETASWGDMNNDGWLDLYITNSAGNKQNQLFQNSGDGNFIEITNGPHVSSNQASRSVDWIDYDNDGDSDIFVTNENNQKNELYQNQGNGEFVKITDLDPLNTSKNSAGSSWADIDNDGDFDLFVANYQSQENQLFLNNNDGTFSEVNQGAIVQDQTWSFGSAFADVDNDGDVDLYVCNAFGGIEKNSFYINNGDGTFLKDEQSAPAAQTGWTFGCAWGDYDNDGFMDLLLANCKDDDQENSLFRNNGNDNNWFKISCEGSETNRSAIGTIVKIKATINGQSVWQMRRIAGQSGYNCQNSFAVHFGLGDATMIDSLIVDWGIGEDQVFQNVNINTFCKLKQGDVLACNPTSTSEVKKPAQGFNIYPNPSNGDFFEIEIPENFRQDPIHLNIIDSTGKIVLERNIKNPKAKTTISSNNLKSGTYHVILTQNKNKKSSTFVIQ